MTKRNPMMAFISRHVPTLEQVSLANDKGYLLISVGDFNAFTVTPSDIRKLGDFDAVCVVHPAAALRLSSDYVVGIFENDNRPVEGGAFPSPPAFKALHLYDQRTTCTA